MWLNENKITSSKIASYKLSLASACPKHVVIDGLFDQAQLEVVQDILQKDLNWQIQQHSYSSLYIGDDEWQNASEEQRFVQRSVWQRSEARPSIAKLFLQFLRSDEFMQFLSRIFEVELSDKHVEDPNLNSNYFRLDRDDFVKQHADDSPNREVCMLLYLNKNWLPGFGGELNFQGSADSDQPVKIAPISNRCVLFNPSSKGSEHWVDLMNHNKNSAQQYRYNVTSWYWSE